MTRGAVALLGFGRFGAAFAELLQRAGHRVRVHDPHAQVPAALAAKGLADALADAQWVVLAMPVPHLRAALAELRPLLQPGQVVFDVGSVKLHPCEQMDEILGDAIAHVGTHPLFGPLSLARGDRPLRVALCPSPAHAQAARSVGELFRALDCEVIELDAASHDRAMARTHAMAFFLAKGLIDFGVDDSLTLAPPSFQGMQRMLDAVRGDAGHLFAAIQRENPYAQQAREQLLAALDAVHRQLQTPADDDSLAIPGSAP